MLIFSVEKVHYLAHIQKYNVYSVVGFSEVFKVTEFIFSEIVISGCPLRAVICKSGSVDG
jgi:hypothetical protein